MLLFDSVSCLSLAFLLGFCVAELSTSFFVLAWSFFFSNLIIVGNPVLEFSNIRLIRIFLNALVKGAQSDRFYYVGLAELGGCDLPASHQNVKKPS